MLEVLTMALGPNALLVAARVDFRAGLDEADLERASAEIELTGA